MTIYGSIVRASYRSGRDSILESSELRAVEGELEKRGLISADNYQEIEQGIVYLDMSIDRAFAALENLSLEETIAFESFTLALYRGKRAPYRPYRGRRFYREVVLACNDRIIGMVVDGLTTLETYSGVQYSQRKVRTNFPPKFFDPNSPEKQKWAMKGRRAPEATTHETFAAGGQGGMFMSRVFGTEEPRTYSTLKAHLEQMTLKGRYPAIRKYLERTC